MFYEPRPVMVHRFHVNPMRCWPVQRKFINIYHKALIGHISNLSKYNMLEVGMGFLMVLRYFKGLEFLVASGFTGWTFGGARLQRLQLKKTPQVHRSRPRRWHVRCRTHRKLQGQSRSQLWKRSINWCFHRSFHTECGGTFAAPAGLWGIETWCAV